MPINKTVYLVDDDADDRMLIRQALEEVIEHIEIIEIHDGQLLLDAIEHQQSQHPALILMDMNMPRVSGLEALTSIKSNPDYKHIPVMMISTTSETDLIRRAYDAGVNAFIVKPIYLTEYIRMAQAVKVCFLNSYPDCDEPIITKNFKDKSILVIEDNQDQWKLLALALNRSMPDVHLIHRKDHGSTLDFLTREYAAQKPPVEMILLDLYLPSRQQGLDLLSRIRHFLVTQKLPQVPVIVLSYSDHPKDITASYAGRANAYMVKSSDPLHFFSRLKDVCSFWWDTITLPTPPH